MNWNEMIQRRRYLERVSLNLYKFVQTSCPNNINENLNYLEQSAIDLRFFYKLPIARVADLMGMSWDGANDLIERAVLKL